MAKKLLSIERIQTILPETSRYIVAVTAGLTPVQLHTSPDEGEWSANEVLAHLRSRADMWGGSMAVILTQDMPTIRAVNPLTWIKKTDYLEQEFCPSLEAFTVQRAELLALLAPMGPDDWSRQAVVTGAGKVLERTVHFYADWLARHEQAHYKQFEQIVDSFRTG